jgi:signal transduction histidine kinase
MAPQPHPLAQRIHNRVLQLLGAALMQSEMCEQLGRLGREQEIPATLAELRESLEQAVIELRAIMAELRETAAEDTAETLKNQAA